MNQKKQLLDLSAFREQKQMQAEQQVNQFLQEAFQFAERDTNIREKVRAKMYFLKRFELVENYLLDARIQMIFNQWFLFDYKTIKGNTIMFQFIQKNEHRLFEPLKMLGALFLAAAWEPVKIEEKRCEGHRYLYTVYNIIHDHLEHVIINDKTNTNELASGQYVFIRKIPLITAQYVLGSAILVQNGTEMANMVKEFRNLVVHKEMTWRSFLKENAPMVMLKG